MSEVMEGKRPYGRRQEGNENRGDLQMLMYEAKRLGQRGEWGPNATSVNSRILELDPDNLAALTRRARCFFEQDDYPAAKKDYEKALQIYPGSKLVKEALAKIDRGWDAARERTQRRAAKARESIKRKRVQAEKLRKVEVTTSFEEARNMGIEAPGSESPNYPLAIAAFKKAYELAPRRKLRPGETPPSGLFEIPTRLARVYRKSGQHYQAQRMYEWILERHDSRAAKVGLAAVHEDKGRHSVALRLYEEVLSRNSADPYALRGVARTLSSLDRTEEAVETYGKALEAAENSHDAADAAAGLKKTREKLKWKSETKS